MNYDKIPIDVLINYRDDPSTPAEHRDFVDELIITYTSGVSQWDLIERLKDLQRMARDFNQDDY